MKPSPLQLERHFFTKVQLDAHPDGDPAAEGEFRAEVDLARATEDPRRYQVTLRLKLLAAAEKKPRYTAELDVVGLVRATEEWPEEEVLQLVGSNGPALLYGAAREMLCNLTARGPWPMVCLPSVSFVQPVEGSTQTANGPAAGSPVEGNIPGSAAADLMHRGQGRRTPGVN